MVRNAVLVSAIFLSLASVTSRAALAAGDDGDDIRPPGDGKADWTNSRDSGDDEDGDPWEFKMGKRGAAGAPWKNDPQSVRPPTTEGLEGRMRDEREEMSPPASPPPASAGFTCSGCFMVEI